MPRAYTSKHPETAPPPSPKVGGTNLVHPRVSFTNQRSGATGSPCVEGRHQRTFKVARWKAERENQGKAKTTAHTEMISCSTNETEAVGTAIVLLPPARRAGPSPCDGDPQVLPLAGGKVPMHRDPVPGAVLPARRQPLPRTHLLCCGMQGVWRACGGWCATSPTCCASN